MTYEDLFLLEDYLKSNLCEYMHLGFAVEMPLAKAVEKPIDSTFDDLKVEGMTIIVWCESEVERKKMTNDLLKLGTLRYTSRIMSYEAVNEHHMIVIDANQSNI